MIMIFILNNKWMFVPRSARYVCRKWDAMRDCLCKNSANMHAITHKNRAKNKRCKRT